MNKAVKYKIANEEEIISLRKLFKDVYDKNILEKEIEWRYLKNPNNEGKIYNCIAVNKDKEIVGHTAFIRQIFEFNKKIIIGGLTSGSAVKSDYAGIFAPMYFFLEKSCSEQFDFFYGFPNKNSFPFFKKIFHYQSIQFIQKKIKFKKNNDFLDQLCFMVQGQKISRNYPYLKWRIEQNPINKYYSFQYKKNNIIWKSYLNGESDVVGILPLDVRLDIKKKDLKENSLTNFFIANSNIIDESRSSRLFSNENSNNFFVYKNSNKNNLIMSRIIYFQMLDIDLF